MQWDKTKIHNAILQILQPTEHMVIEIASTDVKRYIFNYSLSDVIFQRVLDIWYDIGKLIIEEFIGDRVGVNEVRNKVHINTIEIADCKEFFIYQSQINFAFKLERTGHSLALTKNNGIMVNGGSIMSIINYGEVFFEMDKMIKLSKTLNCEDNRSVILDPSNLPQYTFKFEQDVFGRIIKSELTLHEFAHTLHLKNEYQPDPQPCTASEYYINELTYIDIRDDRAYFEFDRLGIKGEMWLYKFGTPRYRVKFYRLSK
jgi:hypothetical protein